MKRTLLLFASIVSLGAKAQERSGAQLAFDRVFEAKSGPCVAARERVNDMGFVEWVAPVKEGESRLVSVMIEAQNRTIHLEWKNDPDRNLYNRVDFDEVTVYTTRTKKTVDCASNRRTCRTFLGVQQLNLKNIVERNAAYRRAPQWQKDVVLCAQKLIDALSNGLED